MDDIVKDRIFRILVEDSLKIHNHTLSDSELATVVGIVKDAPTEVVVYSDDNQVRVDENYRMNFHGQLLLENTTTENFVEFTIPDTIKALRHEINEATSVEAIRIALNLPYDRGLTDRLDYVSPLYENTLDELLQAINPVLKHCKSLSETQESEFAKPKEAGNQQSEILASLVKIITRDPVVAIQEDGDDHYLVFHLSGKSTKVDKPKVTIPDNIADPIHERIDHIQEAVKTRLAEIAESIQQPLPEYNGVSKEEVEEIIKSFVKQFDYTDSIESVRGDLKLYLDQLFSALEIPEKTVETEHHHHHHHKETEVRTEIDYQEVSKLIKRKVDDALRDSRLDSNEPTIEDVQIRHNELVLVFSDGNTKTVGSLIQPQPITYATSGGAGAPGLSAYQIARRNGFKGTEVEWLDSLGGGTYTNLTPTTQNVGGVTSGTVFDNKSFSDVMEMIFYPVAFPTLISPSLSFTGNNLGLHEIGSSVTIQFTTTFNRGSISPQYDAEEPFRSGMPLAFYFTGPGLVDLEDDVPTQDQQSVSVDVFNGTITWTASADYDEGVQPFDSKGNEFNSPLPEGSTNTITRSITGVYPVFATTSSITETSKQPLANFNSTITVNMVREENEDKQVIEFPYDDWSQITRLEQYNTTFERWDQVSLSAWSQSSVMKNINGNEVKYRRYTHNGSIVGARQLRWFV